MWQRNWKKIYLQKFCVQDKIEELKWFEFVAKLHPDCLFPTECNFQVYVSVDLMDPFCKCSSFRTVISFFSVAMPQKNNKYKFSVKDYEWLWVITKPTFLGITQSFRNFTFVMKKFQRNFWPNWHSQISMYHKF